MAPSRRTLLLLLCASALTTAAIAAAVVIRNNREKGRRRRREAVLDRLCRRRLATLTQYGREAGPGRVDLVQDVDAWNRCQGFVQQFFNYYSSILIFFAIVIQLQLYQLKNQIFFDSLSILPETGRHTFNFRWPNIFPNILNIFCVLLRKSLRFHCASPTAPLEKVLLHVDATSSFPPVLGFDCEWVTPRSGPTRPVAMVQLATRTGWSGAADSVEDA